MSLEMITAACPRHKEIVEAAMAPDAPLEAMEKFILEANDCTDCRREEAAAAEERTFKGLLPLQVDHREG